VRNASTHLDPAEINAQLGRDARDERTERALYDLKRPGYIDGLSSDLRLAPQAVELTEKGLHGLRTPRSGGFFSEAVGPRPNP
jgi:hypothetical protein